MAACMAVPCRARMALRAALNRNWAICRDRRLAGWTDPGDLGRRPGRAMGIFVVAPKGMPTPEAPEPTDGPAGHARALDGGALSTNGATPTALAGTRGSNGLGRYSGPVKRSSFSQRCSPMIRRNAPEREQTQATRWRPPPSWAWSEWDHSWLR